jgi:hypothetical protein
VLSTLPDAACATRPAISPDGGTPAGTVVIRSADLRLRGEGTVVAGGSAPWSGELALFCRPVVTAPAAVRRDGTVLADAWLPDLARLGELEPHLGDRVIEAAVDAALEKGRLKPRQRRRIMSYPMRRAYLGHDARPLQHRQRALLCPVPCDIDRRGR